MYDESEKKNSILRALQGLASGESCPPVALREQREPGPMEIRPAEAEADDDLDIMKLLEFLGVDLKQEENAI